MKNPHFSIVVDKEMNLDITKLNIYLNKTIAILHAAATQSDLLLEQILSLILSIEYLAYRYTCPTAVLGISQLLLQ
jgi:hypothetical protein